MIKGGLDIGSTTVKLVLIENEKIIFSSYKRHYSDIISTILQILEQVKKEFQLEQDISWVVTGSAGIGISEKVELPFIQEVIASTQAVESLIPHADVVIELGGEDSKVTFFKGGIEQRMNGTCAGGTGAFIDQMAQLLDTDAQGLNALAKSAKIHYPIASRCGVFAKTDVQPLLNQGARKEDIASSILQAVVNQTITSLSAGRKIVGKVVFLGGPLYFLDQLRKKFMDTLNIQPEDIIFPDNALFYVALGAAYSDENRKIITIKELEKLLNKKTIKDNKDISIEPLFKSEEEYQIFKDRHYQANIKQKIISSAIGPLFLGIDAGSTTTKIVLIGQDKEIYYQYYANNDGEPVDSIIEVLKDIYHHLPQQAFIAKTAVSGYGEELIKKAIHADLGIVETMAHYESANHFYPGVEFILDIGGQDMKAMQVKNGILTSVLLNEACSSGCGSFIETFAKTLKYSIEDFAKAALFAKRPADLGTKCTVFMNSKVKQVQKEGFDVGEISAGLAISVIKNSLYKVIKVRNPQSLGKKIVVQGGTFLNDAVLRAFERILDREVVRPSIAGVMGAYGAALVAKKEYTVDEKSKILSLQELEDFTLTKTFGRCTLCENQCQLTITHFKDNQRLVSGNRCERGANIKLAPNQKKENLSEYRYQQVFNYQSLPIEKAKHGVLGIPRALNVYENYPLWHTLFTTLGFSVVLSPPSKKAIYELGMDSIPSDTVCYPAKISHGHVKNLLNQGIKEIFFPSIIYERNEFKGAYNCLNCIVAQGYPNLLYHNIDELQGSDIHYHMPTLDLSNKETVVETIYEEFSNFQISEEEVKKAVDLAYQEMNRFRRKLQQKGEQLLKKIVDNNELAIVMAGRPYHTDPEINHGIAQVATSLGFHVLTEDSICHLSDVSGLRAVNVWEYNSRMFAAAKVVAKYPSLEFVQLNSFGCGIDAISSDQYNELLSVGKKVATVLKIDEGENLGAVKIRLRSLKASIKEKNRISI